MMSSFEPVGLETLIKKERPEKSHDGGNVSGRCCVFPENTTTYVK